MANGYNFIFNKIVPYDGDFIGIIAYTIYKRQKIEWIKDFKKNNNDTDPTPDQIEEGFSKVSNLPSQIEAYRQQAVQFLDEFLDEALEQKVTQAREEAKNEEIVKAVKKSWTRNIAENLIAGIVGTLLTLSATGLIWVATQGPERLLREAISKYTAEKQEPEETSASTSTKKPDNQKSKQKANLSEKGRN